MLKRIGVFIVLMVVSTSALSEVKEEIIIIEKRKQNLQDISSSMSIFNNDQISNSVLSGGDIRALSTLAPNLYIESSNGRAAPRVYMRGLGNTDFDLAASQPVAIYSDGVVQENVVLKSFPLFDVKNIIVLKGPQGSIYGRNSTAGVLLIQTQEPQYENSVFSRFGAGNLGSKSFEGVINGSLTHSIAARTSVLIQHRDHWVDNGYTGKNNSLGGFEDLALRTQFLWSATENVEALFNVHARTLSGSATIFRANVLSTGSNNLNNNYRRDKVYFDEGGGNPQNYKSMGASTTLTYLMGDYTLTSITGYEKAYGGTQGDVDGGYGAIYLPEMGPGTIPYNAQTIDDANTDQLTQEVLFAFDHDKVFYQVGGSVFNSNLDVTTNPFIMPAATVHHDNQSWSVFGEMDYQYTEFVAVGVGLNYTDDRKSFTAKELKKKIDDGKLSRSFNINYAIDDNTLTWVKYSTGFRGPTIQGRDVAFGGQPSVADSETIKAVELGYRYISPTYSLSSALFWYEIEDYQLSALGGEDNSIRLLNADMGKANGVEFEAKWRPVT